MTEQEIKSLIDKYQAGLLTLDEWETMEHALAVGDIDIEQIPILADLQQEINHTVDPSAPAAIRNKITELIAQEKTTSNKNRKVLISREWIIRGVVAMAAMMTGLIIGVILPSRPSTSYDVAQLKTEVHTLKETMMLTLLQKEGVSDRLKAVSYSYELDQSSHSVIEALIGTLNQDNNINVRLAAVDALQQYGTEPWVREQLIKSIALQVSPLVQVALAEAMVALKEKTSVREIQKLIDNQETPEAVKTKLKGCIQQII